ncbi:LuxR family transcriptional regulator [Rhodococcus fascians]|nr:LuxR family transcriptional regulator [Rhodococcus fascians]MBY3826517.1 LuxR family transcriptional regulator [Rhodococcus fascians]MBY3836978.1 LuxR family transcriptional regulator [Rhodococcus fascians]MBY3865555.1 LuxR family transcriptional regulator [Rhodococcus fascians]MBY3885660.1 LuxR family transcriptional regulator [Rhodococcus fascians]
MTGSSARQNAQRFATSFVGRTDDEATLRNLIGRGPLVSVVGPGGVGKTRLAITVAASLSTVRGPMVAAFLNSATSADSVIAAIAVALGLRDGQAAGPGEIVEYLTARPLVLVLDGCENLDSAGVEAITRLTDAAPEVRLIVTSRRVLPFREAWTLTLAPLATPPRPRRVDDAATPEHVGNYPAVRMFVERVGLVRPDFRISRDNAADIAELCRELDGLPAALELAAAWTRALSVRDILTRLSAESDHSAGSVPQGHDFDRLVADTFHLCPSGEQLLWTRMTCFHNGFTMEALEQVSSAVSPVPGETADLLLALIDKSIVIVEQHGIDYRYRLLSVARRFAENLIAETDRQALASAHFRYYTHYAITTTAQWIGPGQARHVVQITQDHGNIVAAVHHGLAQSDTTGPSLEAAESLWALWSTTGMLTEGLAVYKAVVNSPFTADHPELVARANFYRAYLCVLQGRPTAARGSLTTGFDIVTGAGLRNSLTDALHAHVAALVEVGSANGGAAYDLITRAIDMYESHTDEWASVLHLDSLGIAVMLSAILGRSDEAGRIASRALSLCDEYGDLAWRGYIELSSALDLFVRGDPRVARSSVMAVLEYTDDELLMTHCLELVAWCAARLGDSETAARLVGAAEARWSGTSSWPPAFRLLDTYRTECLDIITARLGAERAGALVAQGRSLGNLTIETLLGDDYLRVGAAPPSPLTSRESQVAELVARGASNREVAVELHISVRTAESHVEHILTKLGLPNRTHVAAWVYASGSTDRR